MAVESNTVHHATTAEALRIVKRQPAKTRFCVRTSFEIPIPESDNRCFPGYALVRITRPEAIKLVSKAIEGSFENRGGRIRLEEQTYDSGSRYLYLL